MEPLSRRLQSQFLQSLQRTAEDGRILQRPGQNNRTLNFADNLFRKGFCLRRAVPRADEGFGETVEPLQKVGSHSGTELVPRIRKGKSADKANPATGQEIFFNGDKHRIKAGKGAFAVARGTKMCAANHASI